MKEFGCLLVLTCECITTHETTHLIYNSCRLWFTQCMLFIVLGCYEVTKTMMDTSISVFLSKLLTVK